MNWIFHRLAFNENTRDRVEVHMVRPTWAVYLDLVALDASDDVFDLFRPDPPKSKGA